MALFAECNQVAAVGVNCTAPRNVGGLVARIRQAAPDVPVVVYPNSGEVYDAKRRRWTGVSDPVSFATSARRWADQGASLIGGCCRTTPHHIRAIRQAFAGE